MARQKPVGKIATMPRWAKAGLVLVLAIFALAAALWAYEIFFPPTLEYPANPV